MKNPHGIALKDDQLNEYWIADTNNQIIRVVRNGIINTLLSNVTLLQSVFGVLYDGAGSLYVTTRRTYGEVSIHEQEATCPSSAGWQGRACRSVPSCLQILRVNTSTGGYTRVAGLVGGADGDGIPAITAKLNNPTYVALDRANGTLFLTEYGAWGAAWRLVRACPCPAPAGWL